jgi:hypothetical protein
MQNAYYDGTNYLYKTSSTAARYFQVGGQHIWYNAASGTAGGTITFTQAMTLDASGNLGVGTTSPSSYGQFAVVGNSTGNIYQATFANLNTGSNTTKQVSASWFLADTGGTAKRVASVLAYPDNANVLTGGMTFNVRKTDSDVSEVARIDSSGNLLVGTASLQSVEKVSIVNSAASPGGIFCKYTGAAPNSTSAEFLLFNDTSTTRMTVRSNGGIANYSANNVNLSDSRTKTNIQDAGNYLAKICAIPVRTFKYKDQTDDLLNLGCIAQEVEAVAPELVDVSGFGETPEDGVPLKAIYQTDLQYALMKALQELKAEFDAYKASHP